MHTRLTCTTITVAWVKECYDTVKDADYFGIVLGLQRMMPVLRFVQDFYSVNTCIIGGPTAFSRGLQQANQGPPAS